MLPVAAGAAGAAGVVLVLVLVLVEDMVDGCLSAVLYCWMLEEWVLRNAVVQLRYVAIKSRDAMS